MKGDIVKYWKVKFEDCTGNEILFISGDSANLKSSSGTLKEFQSLYPNVKKFVLVRVKLTRNRLIEYTPISFE